MCGLLLCFSCSCHPAPFSPELRACFSLNEMYTHLVICSSPTDLVPERSDHPENKPVSIFARVLTGGFQGLPECQSVLLQDITSSCSAAVCL